MNKFDGFVLFILLPFIVLSFCFFISTDRYGNVQCIDGDTFSIGSTYYRLAYIDTAEIGEPTYVASSEYTCDYLLHNNFKLKRHGKDIYGRKLVEVNPNNFYSLNELLVKDCLAEPFWGKTNQRILDLYNNCK